MKIMIWWRVNVSFSFPMLQSCYHTGVIPFQKYANSFLPISQQSPCHLLFTEWGEKKKTRNKKRAQLVECAVVITSPHYVPLMISRCQIYWRPPEVVVTDLLREIYLIPGFTGERVWGFDRFPRQPQVLYNIFISLLVFPADRFSQAAKTERGPRGVHFEETVNLRPLPSQMRCLQLTDT